MPRKEPPAAVDLRIVVSNRGAHGMVRIDVRAPTLRIMRIAFGALLHFANSGFQASKHVR
jgi:hypothetical protein